MDCIGLLVLAFRGAGYELEDCTTYDRRPDPKTLLGYFDLNFEKIVDRKEIEPGDVVLFQSGNKGPQHVAIVTESGQNLLHTWAKVGQVVETRFDERWRRMVHSKWRVRESRWQQ